MARHVKPVSVNALVERSRVAAENPAHPNKSINGDRKKRVALFQSLAPHVNQIMDSYIEKFEGTWKDKSGNCLEIKVVDDYHCSVTFIPSGQETPLRRPWFNDQPATNMIGSYDPQYGPSLDIDLAEKGTGFFLSIDFTLNDYQEMVPSIIRNEEDAFLDQYYHLLGSLDRFIKLT